MSEKGSRRGFIKGVGAGVTTSLLQGHSAAAAGQPTAEAVPETGLPRVDHHPRLEIDLPVTKDQSTWRAVPDGLQGSFVSKDQACFRHEVAPIKDANGHRAVAWRGERVAASIARDRRATSRSTARESEFADCRD